MDIETRVLALTNVSWASANFDMRGFIKLVARDGAQLRLIGAQLVAADACESMQTAALAIHAGMTGLADQLCPTSRWSKLKLATQISARTSANYPAVLDSADVVHEPPRRHGLWNETDHRSTLGTVLFGFLNGFSQSYQCGSVNEC